jgi:hypothetical protein
MVPRGWMGPQINRESHFTYMCLCRKNSLKIFFRGTTGLKKFKFRWNLSDLIQNQVCDVLILGIYQYILKIFSRKTTEPKKKKKNTFT